MAERDLTAAVQAALQQGTIRPALFYEGEFVTAGSPSEEPAFLRMWSGIGTISWNGYDWTGAGNLASFSPIDETRELQAKGFTVGLSGMPSSLISTMLSAVRQGKPGTIWLAFFEADGSMIADPYKLARGLFDVSVIEDNGETCSISVQYESRLINLERPRLRFYTTEDQKIDYPTDRGFEFVAALQDKTILWG